MYRPHVVARLYMHSVCQLHLHTSKLRKIIESINGRYFFQVTDSSKKKPVK